MLLLALSISALVALASAAQAPAAAPGLLAQWGSYGTGNGQFHDPEGIAVDAAGTVFVTDGGRNGRIQKFTSSGTFLGKWGTYGSSDGQFQAPGAIAIDPAGVVYVADLGNHRVQMFTRSGAFFGKWGSFGHGDGQFFTGPSGIALDAAGNVYVTDGGRIQKFTADGAFLGKFSVSGGAGAIAIDSSGVLYVGSNSRIQKFTSDGDSLGGWGSRGSKPGQFNIPHAIAIDGAGDIYVTDTGNYRVQKFTSNGAYLGQWGSQGTGDGQFANALPAIAIDVAGHAYVADAARNPRIQKFNPDAAIAADKLSPPKLAKTVNTAPVHGVVRIRIPGTKRFRVLRAGEQIPVGSLVDTTRGKVRLTSATPGGGTQSAVFSQGLFKVTQRARGGLTELRLLGPLPAGCNRRSRRQARRPRGVRSHSSARRRTRRGRSRGHGAHRRPAARLWGAGKGRFRTTGRHGAAAVRGTIWLTAERCNGTLFKVRRGTVAVRDFTRKRTVAVRAGRRYLAPARRRAASPSLVPATSKWPLEAITEWRIGLQR